MVIANRWKHGVIAVASDIKANVTSDHFQILATFLFKLKKIITNKTIIHNPKYKKLTETIKEFNETLGQVFREVPEGDIIESLDWIKAVGEAFGDTADPIDPKEKKDPLTEESRAILNKRKEEKNIYRKIKKQ